MMVRPAPVRGVQEGFDGMLVAGGIAARLAAGANACIRLDVRAGRHFLEEDFDRFRAFLALESQDAGWFRHERWTPRVDAWKTDSAHFIIPH